MSFPDGRDASDRAPAQIPPLTRNVSAVCPPAAGSVSFSFEGGSSLPPVPQMFQQGRAFVGFGGGHPSFGLLGSALRLGSLDDSYLDEVRQGGYAVVEEDTGEEGAEEEQEGEGDGEENDLYVVDHPHVPHGYAIEYDGILGPHPGMHHHHAQTSEYAQGPSVYTGEGRTPRPYGFDYIDRPELEDTSPRSIYYPLLRVAEQQHNADLDRKYPRDHPPTEEGDGAADGGDKEGEGEGEGGQGDGGGAREEASSGAAGAGVGGDVETGPRNLDEAKDQIKSLRSKLSAAIHTQNAMDTFKMKAAEVNRSLKRIEQRLQVKVDLCREAVNRKDTLLRKLVEKYQQSGEELRRVREEMKAKEESPSLIGRHMRREHVASHNNIPVGLGGPEEPADDATAPATSQQRSPANIPLYPHKQEASPTKDHKQSHTTTNGYVTDDERERGRPDVPAEPRPGTRNFRRNPQNWGHKQDASGGGGGAKGGYSSGVEHVPRPTTTTTNPNRPRNVRPSELPRRHDARSGQHSPKRRVGTRTPAAEGTRTPSKGPTRTSLRMTPSSNQSSSGSLTADKAPQSTTSTGSTKRAASQGRTGAPLIPSSGYSRDRSIPAVPGGRRKMPPPVPQSARINTNLGTRRAERPPGASAMDTGVGGGRSKQAHRPSPPPPLSRINRRGINGINTGDAAKGTTAHRPAQVKERQEAPGEQQTAPSIPLVSRAQFTPGPTTHSGAGHQSRLGVHGGPHMVQPPAVPRELRTGEGASFAAVGGGAEGGGAARAARPPPAIATLNRFQEDYNMREQQNAASAVPLIPEQQAGLTLTHGRPFNHPTHHTMPPQLQSGRPRAPGGVPAIGIQVTQQVAGAFSSGVVERDRSMAASQQRPQLYPQYGGRGASGPANN